MSLFEWGDASKDVVWTNVPVEKCAGCGIVLNPLAPTMSKLCNVCDALCEAVMSEWFIRAQNEFMAENERLRRLKAASDRE
jgi:hypothetical protein